MIQRAEIFPSVSTTNTTNAARVAPANVIAGNLIVVFVASFNVGITHAVTDSLGNTYTQAGSYGVNNSNNAARRCSLWYAQNITGGACTITVTPSAATYIRTTAVEYSGAQAAPFDSSSTGDQTSVNVNTGSVSVAGGQELVCGVFAYGGSTSGKCVLPPANIVACHTALDQFELMAVDAITDSALSLQMRFTTTLVGCASVGASFKPVTFGRNTVNSRLVNGT